VDEKPFYATFRAIKSHPNAILWRLQRFRVNLGMPRVPLCGHWADFECDWMENESNFLSNNYWGNLLGQLCTISN
jgi:hypothetical protein